MTGAVVVVLFTAAVALMVWARVLAHRATTPPPVPLAVQERVGVLLGQGRRRRARRAVRRQVPTGSIEAAVAVREVAAGRVLPTSWAEMADGLDQGLRERVLSLSAAGEGTTALREVRAATGISLNGSVALVEAITA